ncbi:hypothetical protein ER308_04595 [Egibacter rhizosphaerae]|uniref:Helix-turn-helix domain-containing protein n=1 Tax=Egibacter rhizosphaerae TaxID=1670831 RepID=A0A411YCJ9_9ACTN|nr:hypothetical protein [Egibacter rhizosphaerae]QBI18895.1 hypothetical protein ER308_04595 [Egibacter rhizosphaerae]
MQEHERWLSRNEVADLVGRSYDTVRRDEGRGLYPHARRRAGSTTREIPLSDLVEAGHYDPASEAESAEETISKVRSGRENSELREELARAQARIEALEERLADANEDRRFLRRLLEGRAA